MPNSKKIGNKNERAVAEWFRKWTGWDFQRVPQSGGLRWQKDQRISGDLVCPLEHLDDFPFTVETKTRKQKTSKKNQKVRDRINIGHLILDWDEAEIMKYWAQACDDGIRNNLEPLMLLRNGGMTKGLYYVFMKYDVANALEVKGSLSFAHIPSIDISVTNSLELQEANAIRLFKFVKKYRHM